jgi:hypothetical protein
VTLFDDRLKTGLLGERIIDEYLRQHGYVPYHPEEGVAHPFDRLVASLDKQRLCIVEVKTKWRREAYADTGIDRRHFDDYQHITTTYRVPLFLSFVDSKVGTVYGNWWSALVKPRPPEESWAGGCEGYPWEQRRIVYFPLSAMRTLYVLTDADRAELIKLRRSNWKPDDGALVEEPATPPQLKPVQREQHADDIKW